jgi:predicted RNA-binding Zn-ribbon protein involved in translation (DUF1610 family)
MAKRWVYSAMLGGELDLTPEQKREAERRMTHIAGRSRLVFMQIGVMLIAMLICGFSTKPLMTLVRDSFGVSRTLAAVMVLVPMFLIITVSASVLFWHMYRRSMRQALTEMGHEVCVSCGHLLLGLDERSGKCPECGTPRTTPRRTPVALTSNDDGDAGATS